ncbi:T9SS type A sorting domain-containing protein [Flavobacterium sp.]|uniref:T9SS type A sorting domain-containing protein n=1 Tax=Flavobacterium sp. TaxID=239 RepID=UPI00286DC329|nr:T9SS type A sorting domain-containing protein [Flavobacterium sp.]
MKNYIFITLFSSIICFAQAPTIQWQKSLGGTEFDVANAAVATSDGGIVFAGETNSAYGDTGANNNGRFNFWVVKMNASGVIQWQRSLGGTKNDKAYSIAETSDLGFIVAGFTSSNDNDVSLNKGNSDYWIVKLSASGVIEWQKTYGGSGSEEANKIKQTQDGGYIIAGVTNSTDGDITTAKGNQDFWIVKLNADGDLIWQKIVGGSQNDQPMDLLVTNDGGCIVSGRTDSTNGDVIKTSVGYCGWIVKLNTSGAIEWQKCYENGVMAMQYIPSLNEYIMIGYGEGLGGDSWIAKINNAGTIIWQTSYGGSGYELGRAVALTTDGGFLTCGVTYSTDGDVTNYKGSGDFWLVKFDKNGKLIWQKTMGGSGGDIPYAMTLSSLGEVILVGTTTSIDGDVTQTKGKSDAWIVKLVSETLQNNNFNMDYFTLHPNPVSDFLHLTLPNSNQEKEIVITDINGKIITQKKQNTNIISVENLSRGTYIIQIKTDAQSYINKFLKK